MRLEDIPPEQLREMMIKEAEKRERNIKRITKDIAGNESKVLEYKGKEPPELMLRRAVNMILKENKRKRIKFDMGDGVKVIIKRGCDE